MSTLPPENTTNPVCYSAQLKKLNVGITEPKFGSTFVQYPGRGEAEQYPTISVDIKFHAEFSMRFLNQFTHEIEDYPTSSAYDITYSLDTTARLHNMLFFVKTHGLDVNYKEAQVINAGNDGINA
ncbi:MAG: hypothetical protein MJ219_03050 [Mycoplasmoidaceae bacterium]|nr:hypothetical protein [Mycoplasmoidaceae bacterium]